MGEAVGEVAQGGQTHPENHLQGLALGEACLEKCLVRRVADIAAGGDDLASELRQGFVTGVRQLAAGTQGLDDLGRQFGLVAGDRRVAGNAEGAAVGGGGDQLDHFAFRQAEAGLAVQAGDGDVGFQRGRRIGEHRQQVGNEPGSGLGVAQKRLGLYGSGFHGMQGHARHGITPGLSELRSIFLVIRKPNNMRKSLLLALESFH